MFFRKSDYLFLLACFSQCHVSLAQDEKSGEVPKFKPRYDDEKKNEFIRHVVEEGVKPPIFGSHSYDPIRQVFDPPKKGKHAYGGGDGGGGDGAGGHGGAGGGGGSGDGGGDDDSHRTTKSGDDDGSTKERKKFASAENDGTPKGLQAAGASATTREDQTPAWWSKLKRAGPKSGGDIATDASDAPAPEPEAKETPESILK